MAHNEACGLWIEQRSEELLLKGVPHEEIGRIVAGEVLKVFESKVKPRTIAQKARRNDEKLVVTNVTNKSKAEIEMKLDGYYPHEKKEWHESKKSKTITNKGFAGGRGGKRSNAGRPKIITFNETNENIEWARWTWNPVTGCKHGCKYCYARDIANRFYPEKFEPTFRPKRLLAPRNTKIPESRKNEPGINNVFVCSMADLFGEWVPTKWIDAILKEVEANQQWNFIFLTKNPSRYLHFEFKENCWIGATADTIERMDTALETFSKIGGVTKFISCEPLKEEVSINPKLYDSTAIDWLIIGGQSKSSGEPAFQPEWAWVERLICEAKTVGIPIYWKPNLIVRPKQYPK